MRVLTHLFRDPPSERRRPRSCPLGSVFEWIVSAVSKAQRAKSFLRCCHIRAVLQLHQSTVGTFVEDAGRTNFT